MSGYRRGARDEKRLVHIATRLAMGRAIDARLTKRQHRVFLAALTVTTSYSWLYEYVYVEELAAKAKVQENHCREALRELASRGVIVWSGASGRGNRSLLGLVDPDRLPDMERLSALSEVAELTAVLESAAPPQDDKTSPVPGDFYDKTSPVPGYFSGDENHPKTDPKTTPKPTENLPGTGVPTEEYRENNRVHVSRGAPDDAPGVHAEFRSLKRDHCITCGEFEMVDGELRCEGCWSEARAA